MVARDPSPAHPHQDARLTCSSALRKRRPSGLSGAPPGPRQPDQRRAALTSAAAELFASRGIDATTIDDIAARAGVSKGSFYHYFRTKAQILTAVRTRFAVEFRDRVAATVESRGEVSWAEKLQAWVEGMAAAYFDLQPLHDVLFHGAEGPHRELVSEYLTVQHLIELLRSGMGAGVWRVDPQAAAVIMFCGLHGAIDEALITGTPREQIATLIAPLFLQMVGAR
jgi:AcrR family transcriptional regulator